MARFCVGCGLCLGICPVKAINVKTSKGVMTVNFDYSRCTNCGTCIKLCPALFNFYKKSSKTPYAIGEIKGVFFGYSTNNEVRYRAASGGAVTSLLLYMLKRKVVDEILLVRMEKFAAKPFLADNKDDVLSAQGSIYFKTFSLVVLKKILKHLKKGKRLCIVALPCQISILKKILKEFETQLVFIGLICSHVSELWYLHYIIGRYLPKSAKMLAIGPRKDGWPGRIKLLFMLKNNNPQELIVPLRSLLNSLNLSAPLGCLMCTDHLGNMADIVVGDAWHPKFLGKTSLGASIIITRSVRGLELVTSAINDRILYAEEAQLKDLILTQGHNILEGSQYSPFRQKIFQHKLSAIHELTDVSKSIVALLAIVTYCLSKSKTLRRLLKPLVTEKILGVILNLLYKHESVKLLEINKALENLTV